MSSDRLKLRVPMTLTSAQIELPRVPVVPLAPTVRTEFALTVVPPVRVLVLVRTIVSAEAFQAREQAVAHAGDDAGAGRRQVEGADFGAGGGDGDAAGPDVVRDPEAEGSERAGLDEADAARRGVRERPGEFRS